ncbi:hypothetical protein Hypma_007492 [Hypsizygus marmoreus]|uniref:Uncharacterized protein n=1 Tax=Hypsizygus marmoreus TaxID=39966 RepID=A0A369K3I8_HYPMA|nr:hypothetical protein Hypma_007492 [Hypsizygus marmoreus]
METLVALSNIGAFMLQAVTLGQGVRSNTLSIQSILEAAQEDVLGAIDLIIKFEALMSEDEAETLYELCDKIKSSIEKQLEIESARNGLLLTAKTYKAAKVRARREAQAAKIAKAKVRITSQSVQRAQNAKEKALGNVAVKPTSDIVSRFSFPHSLRFPPSAVFRDNRPQRKDAASSRNPFR